ncbi:MAG: Tetratricopeptide domain protein [Promethearchaeota archaeon]|nr:MAG: Tetratricopeptide domain protein [Candidatus Lokiarchaeota archaeon]
MGSDREKAEKTLDKAFQLYDANQFKKAGKYFNRAGERYFELGNEDYRTVIKCYFNAAKAYNQEENYEEVLENLRLGGDTALYLNDFEEANRFFKNGIEYISYLRKQKDQNYYYVLFSTLSYLCSFVQDKKEKGLILLKKIKPKVEDEYFKESPLIHMVTDLTVGLRDTQVKYIEKIKKDFEEYEINQIEQYLAKFATLISEIRLSTKPKISIERKEYTTRDLINLELKLDANKLNKITEDQFYQYEPNVLLLNEIHITLSDNLAITEKPTLPAEVKAGEEISFNYVLKPHFQLDEPFIGPTRIECELDEVFQITLENEDKLKPIILSPPPSLDISVDNLKPPLIGKTFPYEILIENNSEGEALDLKITAEFPEELRVIRGTIEKQVYALKPHEELRWQISLQPQEAGDYTIKINSHFQDPDGNEIENTDEFPFSIKL